MSKKKTLQKQPFYLIFRDEYGKIAIQMHRAYTMSEIEWAVLSCEITQNDENIEVPFIILDNKDLQELKHQINNLN